MKPRLSSTVTANTLTPNSVHPLAVGRSWPTATTDPLSLDYCQVSRMYCYRERGCTSTVTMCMLILDGRSYTHLMSAAYAQQALRCPPTQLTLASPRNVKCSVFTLGRGEGGRRRSSRAGAPSSTSTTPNTEFISSTAN